MTKASFKSGRTMVDAVADTTEGASKPGKLPLILGIILALAGGAGGYFAVASGLLPFGSSAAHKTVGDDVADNHDQGPDALPDIAFVPLEPIVVSLNSAGSIRHLRFRAQLEVNTAYRSDVEMVLPRVMDVLNSYLRALKVSDLEDPLALMKLRAQLLRRIQIATGKGRVSDLLIMDFVLN